jgi:branched-chain amino acid transport system permease protein
MTLFIEQCLNGLQFGLLLFMLAAGLTLVFGIMDLVNLAHGSLYMIGAYFAATFTAWTGNFLLGVAMALAGTLLVGMALEVVVMRRLYGRDHLDHVLATFGLILFFDETVRLIWGPAGLSLPLPSWLNAPVQILPGVYYSAYKLSIIIVSLAVAVGLYFLVMRTRVGMLIRAGRLEPRDGRRARGQYQTALHTGVRSWGGTRRTCRVDAGADLNRTDRDGRDHHHSCFRYHGHWRHRLNPRRICRRNFYRGGRHAGPCLLSGPAANGAEPRRRIDRCARAVVDADLFADGDRARAQAGRPVLGGQQMSGWLSARTVTVVVLLAALAFLPVYVELGGSRFLLTLFTRIIILAMAAVSLNLILGFGGMMSFGHAVYLGIGGYAVGMLAHEGIYSGFVQWPVALAASALFALVIGALSLRTRGVYFIMITLAFAQMAYYIVAGLARYGGDDGLTIYKRSQFFEPINLSNKTQFYYICLFLLYASIYLVWRMVNSRFGMVIQGSRANDTRMRAIGFPTFRYKLTCFVIAGTLCGLAGALLANHTDFVSPAMMYWTRSGDLIIMVVLGGMGSVVGPVFGAVVLLVLEQALSGITEYWQIILGPLLLLVVLFARGGIDGLLGRVRHA